MNKKNYKYLVGAFLLILPIAMLYLNIPGLIPTIVWLIGLIVFNWNPAHKNKDTSLKLLFFNGAVGSIMGFSFVQASKEIVDLIQLTLVVSNNVPFQVSYVTFILSVYLLKINTPMKT